MTSAMSDLCKAAELAENPLTARQGAFHLFRGSLRDEGFHDSKKSTSKTKIHKIKAVFHALILCIT